MDKGAAKTRAVLGGEFDGEAQGAVVDVEGFTSRLHLGGQGLNGIAGQTRYKTKTLFEVAVSILLKKSPC